MYKFLLKGVIKLSVIIKCMFKNNNATDLYPLIL
jgi:hypothetical protein